MIQWREALSVGHPVIDADHRRLLELINLFETAEQANIEQSLFELVRYAKVHFAREEALQRQANFPEALKHSGLHKKLMKTAEDFLHKWETSPGDGHAAMVDQIAPFLKTWLIDHIINEDLKMKPYLGGAEPSAGVRPVK